jgi:tRNA threonylcarbamoyladenosine biosynthesis protein TsaE
MTLVSQNAEDTARLGAQLGSLLAPGDVICLSGDLGAGKTAFTRGVGLGWQAVERVTSPTFTLIHEHRRAHDDRVLYHVDCYRLQGVNDAWGIGLEDLMAGREILVIEWPENIREVLPDERLWITFLILDDTRRELAVSAYGERYRTLLEGFRQRVSGA